ncbi:MAG: YceD family protein [Owenweeksia sp.]
MSRLKEFEIKFSGLKLGKHEFDFQLDKEFFEEFDYDEFEEADLDVKVLLEKKNNALEFDFRLKGSVKVPCDLTTELFDLGLENEMSLLVKFGEEYDDTQEDILIIPQHEHKVDISQYLYELTVLAVPLKKVHPDVASGKKGAEVLKKLEELSPGNSNQTNDENDTDPRWDKLRSLLN